MVRPSSNENRWVDVDARLETGEHNPTWDTLQLLAERLGLQFIVGIGPIGDRSGWRHKLALIYLEREESVASEDVTSPATGTETIVAAKFDRES